MNLQFKVLELKKESRLLKTFRGDNKFIIIGKDDDNFKCQQVYKNQIMLIDGLDILETSIAIPKNDLKIITDNRGLGCEIYEFDIPAKNLTLDIVEDIQEINNI